MYKLLEILYNNIVRNLINRRMIKMNNKKCYIDGDYKIKECTVIDTYIKDKNFGSFEIYCHYDKKEKICRESMVFESQLQAEIALKKLEQEEIEKIDTLYSNKDSLINYLVNNQKENKEFFNENIRNRFNRKIIENLGIDVMVS
jgi:hypothetical protein